MIRLARPYISQEAIDKVVEDLKSGNLVQGKYVSQFKESCLHNISCIC